MFDNTITLFIKTILNRDVSYTKKTIKNVFVDYTKGVNVNKTGIQDSNSILVVIPFDSIEEALEFKTGDFIIPGDYEGNYKVDIPNKYIITSADKKDSGSIPHWEIQGK